MLDGPIKGLKELEMLDQGIVVPNPVIRLLSLVSTTQDITNIPAVKSERQRIKQVIASGQDCMVNVLAKKGRDREVVCKKFVKLQTQLMQNPDLSSEVCLRILRSYRLKMLHELSSNVLQEVYIDSIKVQTLQTCN